MTATTVVPQDILFRAATIITGDEDDIPFPADVRIQDGLIVAIDAPGSHNPGPATRIIEAVGFSLCPGFIDMHAHSDLYLLTHPTHEPKITQGVTTEVIGQDGIGYAPVHTAAQMDSIRVQIAGWNGNPTQDECNTVHAGLGLFEWRSVNEYLDCLDRAGPATNVAVLVPQGNLRVMVCGPHDVPATDGAIADQVQLLRQALADGAVGMSSGLTYTPGMYASTSELRALCAALSEYPGTFYAPHHRSYGRGALAAYAEMLALAVDTGCAVHLTHATLNFAENRGRAAELLRTIDEARRAGADITLDTYPYLAGCTTLAALLPSWASSGGPEATLARLEDKATLEKIRIAVEVAGCDGGHGVPTNWEEIEIGPTTHPDLAGYAGRRVAAAAAATGQAPAALFFDVLCKDRLATACVMHIGNEANVQAIMGHPTHMGGSDAILHGAGGGARGAPHPRAWGTFPRFLGHYARDLGVLPLPAMVAHLTSRPARRLGVYPHRGVVRVGSAADLVLFHPAHVRDTATHAQPASPAVGIRFVLVNGVVAVDEGRPTGVRAGATLRRRADGSVTTRGE